jgi:DNA-binding XRE family transcriptional regulator
MKASRKMATKELVTTGKPDDLQDRARTMAVAILVERIHRLSKEDKEDLYELMKEIGSAETAEELNDIGTGMLEILDQAPVTLAKLDLDNKPTNGLQKWIEFVGNRIREHREAAGMTQVELAEKSGLPQSHISRLEGRKHSPSRATLEKIAKALGVVVSDLDPSA